MVPATADNVLERQRLEKQTHALAAIDVSRVLSERYGAAKDGPETVATVKKTQEKVRQQKWRLNKGHHINVCNNNAWWDLLEASGSVGAIDVVKHLEHCDFKTARKLLSDWYPDSRTFTGDLKTFQSAKSADAAPEPAPAMVLPRIKSSSHADPKHRQNYEHLIFNYLHQDRGIPREIVELAIATRKVYPVEKTVVVLERNAAGEKFAAELAELYKENHWQFSSRTRDYEDRPIQIKKGKETIEAIRFRAETRPEVIKRLQSLPAYDFGGTTETPKILSIKLQPELAHPIQRFFSKEPIATSIRSLRGSFKQCVGPKTQGAFIWGDLTNETKELVLVESAIEALSYAALKRPLSDVCIMGLAGAGNINELFPFLKQNETKVVNAFNNEAAGRKFGERMHRKAEEYGVEVEDRYPPGGEISIEAEKNETNEKVFAAIRDAAQKHQVRFLEKEIQSPDGKTPSRFRMRIESHGEIWKLLDVQDASTMRKARESFRSEKDAKGVVHFRETATLVPICKDWNDVLKGGPDRIFRTDFARRFDAKHDYMRTPDIPAGGFKKSEASPEIGSAEKVSPAPER